MDDFFLHETAVVDTDVQIGAGSKVWHFSHIMSHCSLGANCILGQNVFLGGAVKIGSRVKIQNNVSVYSGVEIEDDVFLGPSMVFTNVNAPRSFIEQKNYARTLVKKGDLIIIISYAQMEIEEAKSFQPTLIFPDELTNQLS